ncbi:hypothetical protein [Cyanobium sp. CH-040]|uniref:hypothetical protein n=1 Tax=Cyanobium sp. CH-040 TaxID=2823708 RepID=UPI0020CE0714|nr:hypothetical protein [Cyanobium sp. CH-040]MCP9928969.1 hypothetical protein [Cyanobium sp. CH-040]
MALRQHRLPRLWLGLTLGLVAAALGAAYWWDRQLPARLDAAAARGDLDACLRYGEQLQALRWLGDGAPGAQGECRRRKAAQLWEQRQWAAALQLQLQVVNSEAGQTDDRRQLDSWQNDLKQQALELFQAGDLEGSLARLEPMGEHRRADRSALGDQLRQIWERNRQGLERASRLANEQRWWEALDAVNRLDHPWWQEQGKTVRAQVQRGISRLSAEERQRDGHGELPHGVPIERLDAEVSRLIAQGMDDWEAFNKACQSLGGRVVQMGPESACQR